MYLKMDTYFIKPNQKSKIQLFNGTFDKSENVIDRDRMLDASFFGNGNRTEIEENQWSEKDSITILTFKSGNEGTWVAGVSTKPRDFAMTADKFNTYLKHDGILDMLSQRKTDNTLKQNAVERYSKHVKTIFQVGNQRSEDWSSVLGYPIEFIPMENPYEKHTGEKIQIKLLRDGKPLANQLVYADFKTSANGHSHNNTAEHSHDSENHSHKENDENHTHTTGHKLRTDSDGIISVNLTNDGIWYVRTIYLINSDEEGLTHESNWATLTFEVAHNHDNQGHYHEHNEEEGLPMYLFILGSVLIIGILFFIFNRKK